MARMWHASADQSNDTRACQFPWSGQCPISPGWNKAGHLLPCGRSSTTLLTCVFSSQHFSSYPVSSRSDVPSLCPGTDADSAKGSVHRPEAKSRLEWITGRVRMTRRGHHGDMSIWVTSILLPIGVSMATAVLTGLTVGPRLAARGKRIQAAHDSRDRFGDSVLDILALCA